MKSFKEQLESIQRLKPTNTQAYYWFTYDLFIKEYKQFRNFLRDNVVINEKQIITESEEAKKYIINFIKDYDVYKYFKTEKQSLMNYICTLFDLQGDLSKEGNKFNFNKIKEIMFCDQKNEQGMMVYGLIKSIGKSYANAVYQYNIATASYYMDRNSLSEIMLTSQEQYDMMESRIQKAIEIGKKEKVEIDVFKMNNDSLVEDAIREFRSKTSE